jgi:hypothetical protein
MEAFINKIYTLQRFVVVNTVYGSRLSEGSMIHNVISQACTSPSPSKEQKLSSYCWCLVVAALAIPIEHFL